MDIKQVNFDGQQLEAVERCCELSPTNRIFSVTGPAGSGKTTTIREVHTRLVSRGKNVVLAAPTGKAARRIYQATGIKAQTIHKLLEFPRPSERDPDTGQALSTTDPKRNKRNPILNTVIIVDEFAMVNHVLRRQLVDACGKGSYIRAFGDIEQLPPIENQKIAKDKTPFEELLAIKDKSVTLSTVYRQGEDSGILEAATLIRQGKIPPRKNEQFELKITDKPVMTLEDYVMECFDKGIDFGKIENQIITPGKKSWVGTNKLNARLLGLLNPERVDAVKLPRESWAMKHKDYTPVIIAKGDKVVCTENTYDMRDFEDRYADWLPDGTPDESSFIPVPDTKMMLNGETGIVYAVHPDGSFEIQFDDRIVEVPTFYAEYWATKNQFIEVDPRKKIDYAWALTTHKCQGSEFSHVIYVMNKSVKYNCGKQNFYTGVTRAKHQCLVITDQPALASSRKPVMDFAKYGARKSR